MNELDIKLNSVFQGKVVRKDITESLKKTVSAPAFVIEYLVGMYCSTSDETEVQRGVQKVKQILSMNFVQPNETEKIKHRIVEGKENGYTIIDKIAVRFEEKDGKYYAEFENFLIRDLEIHPSYVRQYEKLLVDGVWGMIKVQYNNEHFLLMDFSPIQMAYFDINEVFNNRKYFSFSEWQSIILRSLGYEPDFLEENSKMEILVRTIPLLEKNYNLCELGPRGTGKSYLYKEISPYSILMSGGKTTVANLFYNMGTHTVGLVGNWDCVAFDEVAGIDYKNQDSIQILKDYMANGSFARGSSTINAEASIVFVGNIDNGSDSGYMGRRLFEPFPASFNRDSAFFDRMHYYIPGWEIPKLSRDVITKNFGWISDYFSEFCKEMRRYDYSDQFEQYFKLNSSCNIRDEKAIKKTFSGLAKLLFPGQEMDRNECMLLLQYAIDGRKRVKRQLAEMATEFTDEDLGFEEV